MAKFKVGDRVISTSWQKGVTGVIMRLDGVDGSYVVAASNDAIVNAPSFNKNGKRCFFHFDSELQLIEQPRREFILIRRSGAETIAELRHDREVIKSAVATCSEKDTFDFETGAKIAFDRMIGREADKVMPRCKMPLDGEYDQYFKHSKEAADRSRFKIGDRVVDCLFAYGEGTVIGFERDINHDWTWVKFDKEELVRPRNEKNDIKPAPQPAHRFKVGDRVVTSIGAGYIKQVDVNSELMPYYISYDRGVTLWHRSDEVKPEPPKFYTGNVFAAEELKQGYPSRIGRIFEFVDGNCINAISRDCILRPYASFKEICKELNYTKWVEVKSDV